MREIKFRVFDKWNKKFVYFNVSNPSIADIECLSIFKNIEKQQYTGLKDKNGVEIYEGDIIEHHYGLTKVIYGRSHNEMGELRESVGFHRVDINNNDLWCTTSMTYGLNSYEVVGNIYENHELLEK